MATTPGPMKVGAFLATVLLSVTALSACGIGGGDGSITFGIGLDGDHHVTGEKSTFAAGDKFYYAASLKDTVKGNTITLQVTDPRGQKVAYKHLWSSSDDANHVWAGPVNLTTIRASDGAGKYTFTMISGGTEEAHGSFTIS